MIPINFESTPIQPSKIVCIGRNYLEHIKELDNETPDDMVIFLKPNSAISKRLKSKLGEALHYESEICFLIKANKLHAVGFGLDLTKRELQSKLKAKSLPWERAKAFDGAALFSSFVALEGIDISSLRLELQINGTLIQQGGYDLMMFKPQQIIQGVSEFMSLEDGDIIMTGTPKGVGLVESGAKFIGRIMAGNKILVEQQWLAN